MTGQDKVTYIGHSQGTSQMFAALAENFGNMKDKINLFVAICPITNLEHSSASIMKNAASSYGYSSISGALSSFGIHELRGPRWAYIQASLCLVLPCSSLGAFSDAVSSSFNDKNLSKFVSERDQSSASSK